MTTIRNTVLVAVTILASLAGALSPALASCKGAVCVSGTDDGRTHIVYLSNTLSGATGYNIIAPGRSQFELHIDHFEIPESPGATLVYSVQACKKGGAFQSSICTSWEQFTHNVPS